MTLWLDPRGSISHRPYFATTFATFALGTIALGLPYRLSDPTWSFQELGWVVDHPVLAVSAFMVQAGPLVAGLAFLVWAVQAWATLALTIRRCRDLQISPAFAALVLPPGFGRLAWIVFCLLRKAEAPRLEASTAS